VNVTFDSWQPIYNYSRQKLWLAYGIALALSAATVVAGILAIISNSVTYSDRFSTILRTTRHAELAAATTSSAGNFWTRKSNAVVQEDVLVDVSATDSRGNDPLPDHLGRTRVAFVSGRERDIALERLVQPKSGLTPSMYSYPGYDDDET
jgi:hypothetical protein